MDKFVKRLQTRLSRQGFSFSKQQIRAAYQSIVKDHLAPSEAEMSSVINKLKFQLKTSFASSTLTIAKTEVSQDLVEQISQSETLEITQSSHPDIWETLEPSIEQPTLQENASTEQSNSASALTNTEENKPSLQSSEIISQNQVKSMILQVFANQPQEFKEQVTEYALQHSFENVRQVQEFLEQLRGMEFNLLVKTLQDHFNRRGSMLTVLNDVLTNQKTKDDEASKSFFANFNSQIAAFQTEMTAKLSKSL
jgi:hypothetical protein